MLIKISLIFLGGLLTFSVASAGHSYYGWTLSKPTNYPHSVFKLEGHQGWKCLKAGDKHARIRLRCYRVGGLFFHTFEIVTLPKKGTLISEGKAMVKSVLYKGKLNCSSKESYFTEAHSFSGEFLSGKAVITPYKRMTAGPDRSSIMFFIFKDACD